MLCSQGCVYVCVCAVFSQGYAVIRNKEGMEETSEQRHDKQHPHPGLAQGSGATIT